MGLLSEVMKPVLNLDELKKRFSEIEMNEKQGEEVISKLFLGNFLKVMKIMEELLCVIKGAR